MPCVFRGSLRGCQYYSFLLVGIILSTDMKPYYVPGTVLAAGDTAANKTSEVPTCRAYNQMRKKANKQISNKYKVMSYSVLSWGTALAGVVREGFPEEVTCELRPEGCEGAVGEQRAGKGIAGRGSAGAKALLQEGLGKPRLSQEGRGPHSWRGINEVERVGDQASGPWAQKEDEKAPEAVQQGGEMACDLNRRR